MSVARGLKGMGDAGGLAEGGGSGRVGDGVEVVLENQASRAC